jgi:uncharacterized damage-inducible protein DinB
VLREAFAHHAWATERILDACADLTDEQREREIPAIFGSVLDTLRHLVDSDTWYLTCVSDGRFGRGRVDTSVFSFEEVRALAAENAAGWDRLIDEELATADPRTDVVSTSLDGSRRHMTLGVRLAQVVHHGSDHRSQLCTALTLLGAFVPDVDAWAYGDQADEGWFEDRPL